MLPGIDILKFIMAIFVVAIHTHPFENVPPPFSDFFNSLLNIAVPYFFIASGYLLFLKTPNTPTEQIARINKYITHIAKMYLCWTIVYLPITIYDFANDGKSITSNVFHFIKQFIFVGENFYSWPLWYLLCLIYSLLVIRFLYKSKAILIALSLFLFTLSIYISSVIHSLNTLTGSLEIVVKLLKHSLGSGRLFSGLIYICLGMAIAIWNVRIPKLLHTLLFLTATILMALQIPYLSNFALIFIAGTIFDLSLKLHFQQHIMFYWLRKSSSVIYFTHMIAFFAFALCVQDFKHYGAPAFTATILGTGLISILIIKLEPKFTWLRSIF